MPEGATIDAEAGSFRNLTMVTTALVQIAASKTAISAKMIFLSVDLVSFTYLRLYYTIVFKYCNCFAHIL